MKITNLSTHNSNTWSEKNAKMLKTTYVVTQTIIPGLSNLPVLVVFS